MTTTNQAFIKAYRHDAAEQRGGQIAPTAAMPAAVGPSRARLSAATSRGERIASVESIGASVTYVTPEAYYTPEVSGPSVANAMAAPTRVGVSPYAPDDYAPAAPPRATIAKSSRPTERMPSRPEGIKRPLSSFTKRAAVAAPAVRSLTPGTTIASLRWPPACRQLLQRHARQFDRVTESLLAQVNQGRALFGVLGLFRNVGCTTATLCLAARLAEHGRRVVAVDGHFEAPRLSECLDAEPTAWWQDVLEHGALLSDALVRAADDNLDLLPLSPYSHAAPPALQLAATAGALRYAYDVALVDLGTFFDPASQPMALELVRQMRIDSVVAVSGPASCDPRDLETVVERLDECGCELLGTIDNRVS